MRVTAWNNGRHHSSGAGYGVKLRAQDRDEFFDRGWPEVILHLDGSEQSIIVNIDKASFWGTTCRELIHKEIGRWLYRRELAPWPSRQPPQLMLDHLYGNHFRLHM